MLELKEVQEIDRHSAAEALSYVSNAQNPDSAGGHKAAAALRSPNPGDQFVMSDEEDDYEPLLDLPPIINLPPEWERERLKLEKLSCKKPEKDRDPSEVSKSWLISRQTTMPFGSVETISQIKAKIAAWQMRNAKKATPPGEWGDDLSIEEIQERLRIDMAAAVRTPKGDPKSRSRPEGIIESIRTPGLTYTPKWKAPDHKIPIQRGDVVSLIQGTLPPEKQWIGEIAKQCDPDVYHRLTCSPTPDDPASTSEILCPAIPAKANPSKRTDICPAEYDVPKVPTAELDPDRVMLTLRKDCRRALLDINKKVYILKKARQSYLERSSKCPFMSQQVELHPLLVSDSDLDSILTLTERGFEACRQTSTQLDDKDAHIQILRRVLETTFRITELLKNYEAVITLKGYILQSLKVLNGMADQLSCFGTTKTNN